MLGSVIFIPEVGCDFVIAILSFASFLLIYCRLLGNMQTFAAL